VRRRAATPGAPARWLRWAALAAAVTAGATACGGAGGPGGQDGRPARPASAVTAVPATTPPRSSWNAVSRTETGATLGPWELQNRFLVLAALANEGLATVTRDGKTVIVFRGDLIIRAALRAQGWTHIGDPGGWHGYLFDAYQATLPATKKLFEVTTPAGAVHDFVHPLAPGEEANNSFAAVTPDGRWMVSGEWDQMTRLLVFPTPILNRSAPLGTGSLPLAATIALDAPVRDVQGCTFVNATQLLCSTDDPGTDLWPVPRQLLQVTLPHPLQGRRVNGRVTWLGPLPQQSECRGTYEVEGIDYDHSSGTLRVEVRPPGRCGVAMAVYDYQRRS
jgi:hypothetical protein